MTKKKTDLEIRDDVQAELRWDSRLKPTQIGVEVRDGIVTLTGTVESWGQRIAAEEDAHRVAGVLDVANDVNVRVPGSLQRNDADIAQQVRNALQWDVFVPHEKIRTTVTKGIVSLEGEVDNWVQRDNAERAIRNLAGVNAVINRLQIKHSTSPAEVRQTIESALARHAAKEAKNVKVACEDGTVTLTGHVDSWTERKEILDAVRRTQGVRDVKDHLSTW